MRDSQRAVRGCQPHSPTRLGTQQPRALRQPQALGCGFETASSLSDRVHLHAGKMPLPVSKKEKRPSRLVESRLCFSTKQLNTAPQRAV